MARPARSAHCSRGGSPTAAIVDAAAAAAAAVVAVAAAAIASARRPSVANHSRSAALTSELTVANPSPRILMRERIYSRSSTLLTCAFSASIAATTVAMVSKSEASSRGRASVSGRLRATCTR
eukprot:6950529-Prymnesium_polylepis.2